MERKKEPAPLEDVALKPGDLVTDREAAEILGLAVQTLRNWRYERRGPPYRRIGGRVIRYSLRELDAYTRAGTAGKAGAK